MKSNKNNRFDMLGDRLKTYYYVVASRQGVLLTFFLERVDLADILELALIQDGYDATLNKIRGYITQENLHDEDALMKYPFYSDYCDSNVYGGSCFDFVEEDKLC